MASIYQIISYISYFLTLCFYIFYGIKLRDYSDPISLKNRKNVNYILFILVYIPFIVNTGLIFYTKSSNNYSNYLIFNATIIIFLLTPMIIFKDNILRFTFFDFTSADDYIDKRNIKDDENDPNYKIRKKAAQSEYNNRIDLKKDYYS